MNTSNPKFWALIGFVLGTVFAFGGNERTLLDGLTGGLIQAVIWFVISYLMIKGKGKQ